MSWRLARIETPLTAFAVVLFSLLGGVAVERGLATPVGLLALAGLAVALPLLSGRPELILVAGVALSPFAVGPFADSGTGMLQASSLRLPLLVAAAALVLLHTRRGTFPADVVLLFSLLTIWLVAGLPVSPSTADGISYTFKLVVPLAIAASLASLGSKGRRLAGHLAIGVLLLTLVVDYAMLAFGKGYYGANEAELRFGGVSGSGPSTGFVLSLVGVLCLVIWLAEGGRIPLVLWALSLPILLATLTRSGIGGWFVGSVVALALARRWRLIALVSGTVVVGAVATGGLASRFLPNGEGGWNSVASDIESNGFSGINTTGRTRLWDDLTHRFMESPLVGHGVGAPNAYIRDLTNGFLEQPHSEYLSLLVSGGVIALALWITTMLFIVRALVVRGSTLVVACVLTYLLLALVDSPIENYAQGGVAFGLALAWGFAREDTGVRSSSGDEQPPGESIVRDAS